MTPEVYPLYAGMVSYILRTRTRLISSTASFSQFSHKAPLALNNLARIAVQDLVNTGKLDTKSVPAKNINTQPVMPDIKMS